MPSLSRTRRIIKLDDRKWEAAIAYVRSYNEWKLTHKAYGLWSPLEREAFANLEEARKRYNRLVKAIVR